MSGKKRIRFVQDREVRDHNGDVIETFKKGCVYSMPEASADHWLNRNVAVEPSTGTAKKKNDDSEDSEGDGGGDGADEGSGGGDGKTK